MSNLSNEKKNLRIEHFVARIVCMYFYERMPFSKVDANYGSEKSQRKGQKAV